MVGNMVPLVSIPFSNTFAFNLPPACFSSIFFFLVEINKLEQENKALFEEIAKMKAKITELENAVKQKDDEVSLTPTSCVKTTRFVSTCI